MSCAKHDPPVFPSLLLLPGCNASTNGPTLEFRKIGTATEINPAMIGVQIANTGDETALVTGSDATVLFKYLIAGPGDGLPETFERELLPPTEGDVAALPGETKLCQYGLL